MPGLTGIVDLVRRAAVIWHGHRMMIFGSLPQNLKTQAVAVAFSIAWEQAGVEVQGRDGPGEDARARERLAGFRYEFYACLTARADELFELADSMLCAEGPVRTLAGLSLAPEHRRGHGALYDGLSAGRVDIARLRSRAGTGSWARSQTINTEASRAPWPRGKFRG